jgi:hypothetical protein
MTSLLQDDVNELAQRLRQAEMLSIYLASSWTVYFLFMEPP